MSVVHVSQLPISNSSPNENFVQGQIDRINNDVSQQDKMMYLQSMANDYRQKSQKCEMDLQRSRSSANDYRREYLKYKTAYDDMHYGVDDILRKMER